LYSLAQLACSIFVIIKVLYPLFPSFAKWFRLFLQFINYTWPTKHDIYMKMQHNIYLLLIQPLSPKAPLRVFEFTSEY